MRRTTPTGGARRGRSLDTVLATLTRYFAEATLTQHFTEATVTLRGPALRTQLTAHASLSM